MAQGNDVTDDTGQVTRLRRHWYNPGRCSICLRLIWLQLIILSEPIEAPEPRQHWMLCQQCYKAVLAELHRSTIHTPLRLRIAVGLVAAERSPQAHANRESEQQAFQREFAWFMWALILFALLHLVILVILFTIR